MSPPLPWEFDKFVFFFARGAKTMRTRLCVSQEIDLFTPKNLLNGYSTETIKSLGRWKKWNPLSFSAEKWRSRKNVFPHRIKSHPSRKAVPENVKNFFIFPLFPKRAISPAIKSKSRLLRIRPGFIFFRDGKGEWVCDCEIKRFLPSP